MKLRFVASVAAALMTLTLASGCGQKGALFLPGPASTASAPAR